MGFNVPGLGVMAYVLGVHGIVYSLIEGLRVVQGLRVDLYRYSMKNSLPRLVVPVLRRGAEQTRGKGYGV